MFLRRLLQLHGVQLFCKQKRHSSILSSLNTSPVLISNNKDIYTNLALEHWLYTNLRFADAKSSLDQSKDGGKVDGRVFKNPIVLIWTDEPCVVMGRHQNPWIESTLGFIDRTPIKLARRHSGGGCVYHDENNINISIIGPRNHFEKRQENLRFLASVLDEKYGIKCEPNKRHDLVHSDTQLKMSGSAAKLGRFNCYHHFTLLVDSDKEIMQTAIRQTQQEFIKTNSSLSKRSNVINLKELKEDIDISTVISDLAFSYGKLYKTAEHDQPRKVEPISNREDYDSLKIFKDELESWDWIYGKTPKFKLERIVNIVDEGIQSQVTLRVTINHGKFENIEIDGGASNKSYPVDNFKFLIGSQFTYKEAMLNIVKMLQPDPTDQSANQTTSIGRDQLLATYLLQMVQDANF